MDAWKGRQRGSTTTTTEPAESADLQDPLYGVAMLKLALALKRPGAEPFDTLVTQVLGQMGLDEERFRRFLAQQGGLLRTLARPPE